MISSHGELSTQALENVEKARAASRRSCSSGVGSNTLASATAGSSSASGFGNVASEPIAASLAPSSSNHDIGVATLAETIDLTKDTADLNPLRSLGRN
jgi:hypothetical protein